MRPRGIYGLLPILILAAFVTSAVAFYFVRESRKNSSGPVTLYPPQQSTAPVQSSTQNAVPTSTTPPQPQQETAPPASNPCGSSIFVQGKDEYGRMIFTGTVPINKGMIVLKGIPSLEAGTRVKVNIDGFEHYDQVQVSYLHGIVDQSGNFVPESDDTDVPTKVTINDFHSMVTNSEHQQDLGELHGGGKLELRIHSSGGQNTLECNVTRTTVTILD